MSSFPLTQWKTQLEGVPQGHPPAKKMWINHFRTCFILVRCLSKIASLVRAIPMQWPSGLGLGFSPGCFLSPPSEAAVSSSSGHLKYVAEGCEDHWHCSHRWGVWHDNVLLHCLAVMNSTVYYAKYPTTLWHSKLSSSPRQGNETKSTDQMTIQDVLSRLKPRKSWANQRDENNYH